MILDYLYNSNYRVVVIYDGESQLNGERIVCFMYLKKSNNSKVENSYYTVYVPYEAETNHHESVCGGCQLKSHCFTKGYMQTSYYKWLRAYKEGKVPLVTVENLKDLKKIKPDVFRFGMHGDPASIPFEVTEQFISFWQNLGVPIIGYTHQYNHPNFDTRYNIFLHSVESIYQKEYTTNKTARIILNIGKKKRDEVICPYDLEKEMNGYTTISCKDCLLCDISKNKNIAFLPKKLNKNFNSFLTNA